VSAPLERAQHIPDTVAGACFAADVPFKHLAARRFFLLLHHKHADRVQAGKFCSLYPAGTGTARRLMDELSAALHEEEGAYVLSDRRYRDSRTVLSDLVAAVRPVCGSFFVRGPGMLRGRAGLIAALGMIGGPEDERHLEASVRNLSWHAVRGDGGLLFPGLGLLRLSADLASGSAGVLLALHTLFEGMGDLLPLL
jgi:hypothetical protein